MKKSLMVYDLFHYYVDELARWNLTVEFHKEEARAFVSKIVMVADQQGIDHAHERESNSFIDLLMVQQQEFDHLSIRIVSQQQRFEQTISFQSKPVDDSLCQQQDTLRSKMHAIERTFVRTKYNCSVFLSSFLSDGQLVISGNRKTG
jgi:hypothetical protein